MPNWPLGPTESAVAVTALICVVGVVGIAGLPTVLDSGRAAESHGGDGPVTAPANRAESPTAGDPSAAAAGPRAELQAEPTESSAGTSAGRRFTYTVGEGPEAIEVRVVDSGRSGPTALVVGGVHGDEPAGYRAAHDVANWRIDRGTLVVIPEANPRAVERGTRKVNGLDLNSQFPVGERPATEQARIVWRVVKNHDPDVVVDLHSSQGIYGVDDGVGQAVFPSETGDAATHASVAIRSVNEAYDLTGDRSFRRGNGLGPSGRTLTRKAIGDRNATAYIVETTKRNTTLRTRIEWTKAMTWELLRLHGVVDEPYRSAPPTGANADSPDTGPASDDSTAG